MRIIKPVVAAAERPKLIWINDSATCWNWWSCCCCRARERLGINVDEKAIEITKPNCTSGWPRSNIPLRFLAKSSVKPLATKPFLTVNESTNCNNTINEANRQIEPPSINKRLANERYAPRLMPFGFVPLSTKAFSAGFNKATVATKPPKKAPDIAQVPIS